MIDDAVKRIDDAYTLHKLEEMIRINSVEATRGSSPNISKESLPSA